MRKKDVKVLGGFLTAALGYSLLTTCPLLLPVVLLGVFYGGKRKRR